MGAHIIPKLIHWYLKMIHDVISWNYCHGPKPNNNLLSFALRFCVKQKIKLLKVIGQRNPKGAKQHLTIERNHDY